MELIDQLIGQGYLKTPEIIKAFKKIERADFIPEEVTREKGRDFVNQYNAPIPIGYGQTISQPLTVAFMLELLQPKAGNRVLDIGAGSGWQSALLAEIVGPEGFVYAVERISRLKNFGRENAAKYGFKNIEFICADGAKGLPEKAPFDRIVAAAAAEEICPAWQEQLAIGGRLVAPIKNSIWLYLKKGEQEFKSQEFPGFAFVPLVEGL